MILVKYNNNSFEGLAPGYRIVPDAIGTIQGFLNLVACIWTDRLRFTGNIITAIVLAPVLQARLQLARVLGVKVRTALNAGGDAHKAQRSQCAYRVALVAVHLGQLVVVFLFSR